MRFAPNTSHEIRKIVLIHNSMLCNHHHHHHHQQHSSRLSSSLSLLGRLIPLAKLEANLETQGLAEETLAGVEVVLAEGDVVAAGPGSDDELHLHLGDVAADAGAGAVGEGDEGVLLAGGELEPAVGVELVGVGAPDLLGVVDRVGGDGEDGAGREVVAVEVDAGAVVGDLAGETNARGGVEAEGLVEDGLEVGQVLDHVEGGDVNVGGDGAVELLLELLDDTRSADGVEEEGTGRVGGGVGAGNELGEGLSGELLAAELLTLLILAFLETGEQIGTLVLGRVVETVLDASDGHASEVLNSVQALGEEGVGEVLGEGLEPGHDTESGRDLTAAVQNLNGGSVDGRAVGRSADLGHIGTGGKHAEGSTESQVTDDVEGKEVEPVEAVKVGAVGVGSGLGHVVPLLDEELKVAVNVGLELKNRLDGEGVRDDLALARVLSSVSGVEETSADADEGVIEVAAKGGQNSVATGLGTKK